MASEAGAEIVKQFLHQYYQLYDTDGSREPLHQAYHESAQFSYDAFSPSSDPQFGSFGQYLQESRNLYRVSHVDKRVRLLKRGKLSIVEALNNLPRTRHDPTSFVVDLVVFTPHLIQLNVCGLFNEVIKKQLLRYFSRVFTIVSVGSGFCIMNDQLTILPPTAEQIKRVNKLKAEAAAAAVSAPVAQPPPLMPVANSTEPSIPSMPMAGAPDLATKQQMVTTLSLNSGMNLLWSEKCLNETNWNYEQAIFAFTKLQKAGSIPAEAFVK
uniref:Nuclear RNA export factor 1 n=1 Tax=Riptortus pedestris TaxID=329032 RepID=R4WE92_RIPPE|nr:conserved hypothetical protein [Riptortus pedestris]